METRAEQRADDAKGAGLRDAGTVLVWVDDPPTAGAVRAALTPFGWRLRESDLTGYGEEVLPPDVRAIVVGPETAAAVIAVQGWRIPVVVVEDHYDAQQALDVVRRGAADCLGMEQLDRLPGILRREVLGDIDRQSGSDARMAGIVERLLAPPGGNDRLDDYCEGLARSLDSTVALLLVSNRPGEFLALGAYVAGRESLPTINLTAEQLDAMRAGEVDDGWGRRLGLPLAASLLVSDVPTSNGPAGAQVLARDGAPWSPSEKDLGDRLGGLAALALDRADAVTRLRRNDAIKTDFVRTVSHELRTPLNTVIGYADLLVDEAFGPLDDEQRKILRRVGDRARGLLEVIAATLELPGVDGGRVSLEKQSIVVEDLMAELEADAREWRVRSDLEYVWDVAQGLPGISTDVGKLRVLLKNLIANATKFTDRGGITVRARARDGGVEFSVEDTGIGIEGEAVHFVFDAFRQASVSNARQYGGVGLGLYIVRRLVGMLGGRLRVESEVGVGSKFFVWLPADAG